MLLYIFLHFPRGSSRKGINWQGILEERNSFLVNISKVNSILIIAGNGERFCDAENSWRSDDDSDAIFNIDASPIKQHRQNGDANETTPDFKRWVVAWETIYKKSSFSNVIFNSNYITGNESRFVPWRHWRYVVLLTRARLSQASRCSKTSP